MLVHSPPAIQRSVRPGHTYLRIPIVAEPLYMDEVFHLELEPVQCTQLSRKYHRPTVPKYHVATLPYLPTELLLQILTDVPARQLGKLRQVCKIMKSCIDDNEAAILRSSIKDNRERIARQIDYAVHVSGIEFDEAMQRYYRYYGPDQQSIIWTDDPGADFIQNWVECNHPRLPPNTAAAVSAVLRSVARMVVEEYYDPKDVLAPNSHILTAMLQAFTDHGYYKQCPQHLIDALRRLQFVDRWSELDFARKDTMPRYFLRTDLSISIGYSLTLRGRDGHTYRSVSQSLGIPDLGETDCFRYRVKAKEAWWIVLHGSTNCGQRLSLLQQAAVLDEIFIW